MSKKPDDHDVDDVEDEDASASDTDDEDIEEHQKEQVEKAALDHTVFVHVFDQVIQDSEAVLAILQDILVKIKARNPKVENAYMRSDNAGCYHSAQTILNLPQLSKVTGITIQRFDFSDPQGGKGTPYVICILTISIVLK